VTANGAVRGIHHVNLLFDDLEESRRFYRDAFGFTELPRPDFGFPGAWFEMGRDQLHLSPADGAARNGTQHFALHIDDFDAIVARLREAGVRVSEVPRVPGAGRQAFLSDPAGNLIELNQPDRG
jgi:catechol 2,3-dioxygenase-like lactoylglutathione lyase family enzyme